MGIKEVLQRLGEKGKARKEMLHQMDQQVRMQKIIEERQMSSNERELRRFQDEDREEMIKERLKFAREQRQKDINFNHNPIDAENIITKTQWEVLKEKNQFSNNGNMFANQQSIHKNNKNLMKNNQKLLKGGNMFKI